MRTIYLLLLTVFVNAFSPTAGATAPPNIVFILTDDLGYGDLGVYGQNARAAANLPAISTPNLDSLASSGMMFQQFYAGCTVCKPSRETLMMGVNTGHTIARGNQTLVNALPTSITLPELLQTKGYTTGAFGKWGLDELPDTAPNDPNSYIGSPIREGFDQFFGYFSHVSAQNSFPTYLWDGEQKVPLAPGTYSNDLIVGKAMDFIAQNQADPFFLYLPITNPHADTTANILQVPAINPLYANQPWPTVEKQYASLVTLADTYVGEIVSELQQLGIADNTLIIFTSDNGPHAEGGQNPTFFDSAGPLDGIKRDLYEGGIRVPMIAYWPGTIAPGQITDRPTALWDVMPTLLDLAGKQAPSRLDGVSFAPLLQGQPQAADPSLYWEFLNYSAPLLQAARVGDWKGVKNGSNPIQVFNLATDPGEHTNVAAANPNIATMLLGVMNQSHSDTASDANPVNAVLTLAGDAHGAATDFTLDFGTMQLGQGPVTKSFRVANAASDYSYLMAGNVDTAGITDPRLSADAGNYAALVDGESSEYFTVTFTPLSPGALQNQYETIRGFWNYDNSITGIVNSTVTLHIAGRVFDPIAGQVPEPSPLLLLLGGGWALWRWRRRR